MLPVHLELDPAEICCQRRLKNTASQLARDLRGSFVFLPCNKDLFHAIDPNYVKTCLGFKEPLMRVIEEDNVLCQ